MLPEYAVAVAVLLASLEGGVRLSRVERFRASEEQRSHVGTALAALLAVVGFVLAFSFSIVEARFAARKALVLEEANAIGTTYLRTDFLAPPEAERSKELLREYVDARLALRADALRELLVEAERAHGELWSLAVRAAEQRPQSLPVSLYITSLNEVIDLHESRLTAAVRNRLPRVFVVILVGGTALAVAVLGYAAGLSGSRNLVATLPFILLLAALIVLVLELDRPDVRIAQVGRGALLDLQRSFQGLPPVP